MKRLLSVVIMLIFILFPVSAQKSKDVLYLKNGSTIYGKLIEIVDDQYKIQTSDGSVFIFKSSEVDKFAKDSPVFNGRRVEGFGSALEAGFLVGAQNSSYVSPFSFNFLASFTSNTSNIISLGSGVEFIGVPFAPIFIEYKYLMNNKKAAPFLFARGGRLFHLGMENVNENNDNSYYYQYDKRDYKGGFSCSFGTGITWAKDDNEPYLSFAYRYAATSYVQRDYSNNDITYKNSYNRLEVKFGFRF
jgi:hypothetical protein